MRCLRGPRARHNGRLEARSAQGARATSGRSRHMTNVLRLRRELVIGALFVIVGTAVAIAIASDGRSPFRAHFNVIAAGCRSGFVAESDAAGRCVRAGSVEGPIESFTLAEQRALKETAPFQTVQPGAYAAAMAARAKKQRSGGSWAAIGNTPLYANSPDYAGADPVLTAGPSRLGWVGLSGRITAFAS